MSRTPGGPYQSGDKPVEELKPPSKGPGLGVQHADYERGREDERRAVLRWLRTYWPNTAYEIANKIEDNAHRRRPT